MKQIEMDYYRTMEKAINSIAKSLKEISETLKTENHEK